MERMGPPRTGLLVWPPGSDLSNLLISIDIQTKAALPESLDQRFHGQNRSFNAMPSRARGVLPARPHSGGERQSIFRASKKSGTGTAVSTVR